VLLEPGTKTEPFAPAEARELSAREWLRLREAVGSTLATWAGASLMGLHVGTWQCAEGPTDLHVAEATTIWTGPDAATLLSLPPTLGAGLVVLTLGGKPSTDEAGPLTSVDLAVLDAWADHALRAVLGRLQMRTTPIERQTVSAAEALERMSWPVVTVTIESPVGDALLVMARDAVRDALQVDGPRLGDDPRALLTVAIQAEARLDGADISLADLLTVGEGDVVVLGESAAQSVGIFVAGQRVANGRAGVQTGRVAVRIESTEDLRVD